MKKLFPTRPTKGSKVEIPEWRSAKSKHFLKDDGTFEMEVSKDSLFYQDPVSKTWKDIDNTLVPSDTKGSGLKQGEPVCRTIPSNDGTGFQYSVFIGKCKHGHAFPWGDSRNRSI